GVVVAIAMGMALGVAVAFAGATGTYAVVTMRARRRAVARRRSLIAAVRLMAAELEAGSRPSAALRAGAETSPAHAPALLAAAGAVDVGADVRAALASFELG